MNFWVGAYSFGGLFHSVAFSSKIGSKKRDNSLNQVK